jgi:hypothetical protein
MAGHWTDLYSFVFGAVRYQDLAYLILSGDEMVTEKIPHSIVIEWDNGTWNDGGQLSWRTAGVAIASKPREQLIVVGEFGDVLLLGSGDRHEEHVWHGERSPAERGPLRGIRSIGDSVFAVGMDRQVYRRDRAGVWSVHDSGLPPTIDTDAISGLESIDGFDEQDLYAVGWDGEIWWFQRRSWQQIASPTNLILTDVCCGGDGQVYACGQLGTILRGREGRWDILEQDAVKEDLWHAVWFGGSLYVASLNALYTLVGDELEIVDPDVDPAPETFFHLSVRDNVMWSIGAKDVLAFDGESWHRID